MFKIISNFKIGSEYEIKEGKYYSYITKKEMEDILNNSAKIINYFSTKRKAINIVLRNFIIKKQN